MLPSRNRYLHELPLEGSIAKLTNHTYAVVWHSSITIPNDRMTRDGAAAASRHQANSRFSLAFFSVSSGLTATPLHQR